MKEIIDILRQRLILAMGIHKLVMAQRDALKAADGIEVKRITSEMDPLLVKLGKLDQKQKGILKDGESMADWLKRQSDSPEKTVATTLLGKLSDQLIQLKQANKWNMELLENNVKFIDYNINVITQTSAGPIYGASRGGESIQGIKMFDTGV